MAKKTNPVSKIKQVTRSKQKQGLLVWITGLPGSGKTTIAEHLHGQLADRVPCVIVDGDKVREIMGHDLGYNMKDRLTNAYRISRLSKHLTDHGLVVICATVSLFKEIHEWNRKNIENLLEIYIDVPFKNLVERDQKNMYSSAIGGKQKNVRGVDQNYDVPKNPHLIIKNGGDLKSFLDHARVIKKMILKK